MMKYLIKYALCLALALVLAPLSGEKVWAQEKPEVVREPLVKSDVELQPADLAKRISSLEEKIEQSSQSKDVWDKLEAISGIIAGILVALIGFYATNIYNRRQREREQTLKERELSVNVAQAVERFLPHLSSSDEREKEAALLIISTLLGDDFAAKLAARFGGAGSGAALKKIAATAYGKDAELSIPRSDVPSYREDIFRYLTSVQNKAITLIGSGKTNEGISLIDKNLKAVDEALQAFPSDADFHALLGYILKDAFQSSRDILPAEQRKKYLVRARQSFKNALRLDPNNASAHNGLGNILFFEGRFDDAISEYDIALKLTGGNYAAAAHDKRLAIASKNGEIPFTF